MRHLGRKGFARDLSDTEPAVMSATHGPTSVSRPFEVAACISRAAAGPR
jgi:hypothetical protein